MAVGGAACLLAAVVLLALATALDDVRLALWAGGVATVGAVVLW